MSRPFCPQVELVQFFLLGASKKSTLFVVLTDLQVKKNQSPVVAEARDGAVLVRVTVATGGRTCHRKTLRQLGRQLHVVPR